MPKWGHALLSRAVVVNKVGTLTCLGVAWRGAPAKGVSVPTFLGSFHRQPAVWPTSLSQSQIE
jgi:hypothetical protein